MLHLYYKEGKLTKWRKVPIDFRNHDEAKKYYEKNLKGPMTKYKILFEEEEKQIAEKKEKRKEKLKTIEEKIDRGTKKIGKKIKEGAVKTHERLKVAAPREMENIKRETPDFRPAPTYKTAYQRRLDELRKRDMTVDKKQLEKLAEKRYKEEQKKKQKPPKRQPVKQEHKEWRPPPSPFGELHFNPQGANPFLPPKSENKETSKKGIRSPFQEVHFNPNVNPFGLDLNKEKKKRR